MKRLSMLCIVLLFGACTSNDRQPIAASDEQEVEAAVRAAVKAENDKDADAFLALWTDAGLEEYDVGSREDLKAGKSENFGADPATIVGFSGTEVTDGRATTTVDATLGEHSFAMAVNRVRFDLIERNDKWLLNGFQYLGGAPPDEDATVIDVRGEEYAFVLEGDEVSGDVAFRFENVGKEPHEITLFKGSDDLTIEKAAEDLVDVDGSDPHDAPEGYEGSHVSFAEAGQDVDVSFAEPLEAGKYVLACYIPQGGFPEEGEPDPNAKSHFELGMRALLEVG